MARRPYRQHLQSSADLVTTYAATRAGFVALALEKNRRATPHVAAARTLQAVARKAKTPSELLALKDIEAGLLTAAGLSDKALNHLAPDDRQEAITSLVKNFLEPAGDKFVEELVFRFLLTRGDTLGGSMRNVGGVIAQRRLTRAVLSTLTIAGLPYRWQHLQTRKWVAMSEEDADIELSLRGLAWERHGRSRTLIYNLTVPVVRNNVDLCLFSVGPERLDRAGIQSVKNYIAIGELKGGIDPAGADEHWKTARSALDRIREAFASAGHTPELFFVGAAVEKKMADEIWSQLMAGRLANAANLNETDQVASLSRWLCAL